jgi:hypothetical protein
LWPTGFKTVRRTESSKKKILSMSTFLILAPEQRKILLLPVAIFFPSGLLSLGLLPHRRPPVSLTLPFDGAGLHEVYL